MWHKIGHSFCVSMTQSVYLYETTGRRLRGRAWEPLIAGPCLAITFNHLRYWTFPVTQLVKRLPRMIHTYRLHLDYWTSKICNANFASDFPLPESATYRRFNSGTKIEDFAR